MNKYLRDMLVQEASRVKDEGGPGSGEMINAIGKVLQVAEARELMRRREAAERRE